MSRVVMLCAAAVAVCGGVLMAGPLNPPSGPIAGTSKPLSEVEPRIAVNAVNTPGDVSAVFRIMKSGSYYLTGNVQGVAGKNGVGINVSNVTLDLNGFSIEGAGGSLNGVLSANASSVCVRNGTVKGWAFSGINVQADGALIEGILSEQNGLNGFNIGAESIVRGCSGLNNAGAGIVVVGSATTVDNCTATQNNKQGFTSAARCVFRGCTAEANGQVGFDLAFGSAAIDCVSGSNIAQGIKIHQGGTVMRCTVTANSTNGIETDQDSYIRDCVCDGNGTSGIGAGIMVTGVNNRIESNNCTDNKVGINVSGTKNFIVRNTCSGNPLNWAVAFPNKCLVVLGANTTAAISGDSGGTAIGSTDPNANFTY